MKPQLAVIIPCYNCAVTLEAAVLSCFNQGFSDRELEIILVDDKSTDTTQEVIQNLAATYPHIRHLSHDQNRGGGATRNTGMHAALAPVLFCLDSDDLLPPNTLRTMYDYLITTTSDGVGFARSTKFRGTDTNDVAYITDFSYVGERIPLESLLQKNSILCSLYSVFMLTKDAFLKAGGYPTTHGFDTQGFAWRFLAAGLTARVCPNTNYLHRVHHSHSYYLREYDQGRANINWQIIFLEHAHLFTPNAVTFITTYNVRDFTKSFFSDLVKQPQVFKPEAERQFGISTLDTGENHPLPVARNSLRGLYYRMRNRLKRA